MRRLLVYGGNQHGERRRIGVWPDKVGPNVFQDTYGSSMRSPSFGIGVLDHNPFLILRKIENFGERAYPLALLLDPGRDTWKRFKWNGAHLLWALFGKIDCPGIKLLTDPDSYHTDEHLEKLLSAVDDSIPPPSDSEEIADPEHLLDLWSGAVCSRTPLIAQVDPQLTGFSGRPDLKGLSELLSKLPESLRCGQGWLFGGRDRHAESLGAHLVFDDGKLDPPRDEDRKFLLEYQTKGSRLRTALEMANKHTDDGDSYPEFLSTPVFEWTTEWNETAPELLDDLLLLDELDDRREHQIVPPIDDDKRFTRINTRLKRDGKLNKQIIAAADRFLAHHQRKRTEAETVYILNQAVLTETKLGEEERGRLNEDAASLFFIEKKIYPAQAADWMPQGIRFRVSQELLEEEQQIEDIPELLRNEAALIPSYDEQKLESLVEKAIQRSADQDSGLRLWEPLLKHPKIGDKVREVVQTTVLHRVSVEHRSSLIDYLLLVDDGGGKQLTARKPGFRQTETLETLLQMITEQLDSYDPRLVNAAKQWLNGLAKSELRLQISLKEKDEVAGRLKENWESYVYVRSAFQGDPQFKASAKLPDEQEQSYLVQELAVAAKAESAANYIPNLDQLAQVFEPPYLGVMIEALVDICPYFDGHADPIPHWIEGWSRLGQHKKLDEIQRSMCLAKYRTELVRLILETDTTLKGRELKALQPENWTQLFRGLLIAGEVENDNFLRRRLVEVSETLGESKEANQPLQSVIEAALSIDTERAQLVRRYLKQDEPIAAIKKRLTPEQKKRFKALFEEQSRKAIDDIKNRLRTIFSSGERGSSSFDFIGRVNVDASKFGDDVFKKALTELLEEMAEDTHLRDLFLSGGASSQECLQFFDQNITQQRPKKLLAQLRDDRQKRKRIAAIEHAILKGGGPDTDRECHKSLATILKDHSDDITREALSRVLQTALEADDSLKVLIRRFVRTEVVTMFNQQSLEMRPDKLFHELFNNITAEASREFLGALWRHYEAKHGEKSPMIHSARHALKTLEQGKNLKKGSKKSAASQPYLDPFPRSLLDFLAYNPTHRKHAAQLEFGANRVDEIENLVRDFVPDFQEYEIKAHVATSESSDSIRSRFKRLWKRPG